MSEKKEEKTLAQMLDEDKGFIASRRLLMTLSVLLLVTVFGGVTIKEANTFIFKLEFVNPEALGWILWVSILFCAIRYYTYAYQYHEKIQLIWTGKLMRNRSVFCIIHSGNDVGGILAGKIRECPHAYPYLKDAKYHPGILCGARVSFKYETIDDEQRTHIDARVYNLNEYDGQWTKSDHRQLNRLAWGYRLEAIVKNREYLGVLFPYWVAIAAMLSYFIAPHFINDSTQSVLTSFQLLCHPLDA